MHTIRWGRAGIAAICLFGTLSLMGCPPMGMGMGGAAGSIAVGGSASGTIMPRARHRYNLAITYPQTVTIYVAGHGLDPMVRLIRAGGGVMGVNDDGGNGLDAQLFMTLAPGNYVIEVFGFMASNGPYTLTVR